MKTALFIVFITLFSITAYPNEKRDILQKESERIGMVDVLIKDFSEIGFPDYQNRDFWNNLPDTIRKQYIEGAEEYIDYDWPAVKATDYLEIIRSGDRRQNVYSKPRAALTALVMGELVEGEGRFLDDLINGVWYYSEQSWWGWSAHLYIQSAPRGLPD